MGFFNVDFLFMGLKNDKLLKDIKKSLFLFLNINKLFLIFFKS